MWFYFSLKWPLYSSHIIFSVLFSVVSSQCVCRHTCSVQCKASRAWSKNRRTHTGTAAAALADCCQPCPVWPTLDVSGIQEGLFQPAKEKPSLCYFYCHIKADQAKNTVTPFLFLSHQPHLCHVNNNSSGTDSSESWLMTHCCVLSTCSQIDIQGAGNHSSQLGF